jgi:hypothetical protein
LIHRCGEQPFRYWTGRGDFVAAVLLSVTGFLRPEQLLEEENFSGRRGVQAVGAAFGISRTVPKQAVGKKREKNE